MKINENTVTNYIIFLAGIILCCFSFSVFYAPYDILTSGSAGLALIVKELTGLSTSVFVAIVSYGLLIVSFIFLGKDYTLKALVGTILYPIFLELTDHMSIIFNKDLSSMLLITLYGGALMGIGSGMILKTGFSTGGFSILYQMLNKYLKISLGNAMLIVNGVILVCGVYIFGLVYVMYAIIALVISSVITDRVIIGVSNSKTFYVITSKEVEVKELIKMRLNHTVTEINAKGGYTNKNKKMLMCVIPTKDYFVLKEVVREIDKEAFLLITDTYEVS